MRSVLAASALALSVLLLGCSSDDPVGPSAAQAEIRVAHLSPDAPAVDVWVDNARTLTNVPFKAVSDYLLVPAGSHRIQVTPTGATAPVVIDATVTLSGDTSYTVAATGLLGAGDLSPVVLIDERDPPRNTARVRFVHAAPDAPAVDITADNGPYVFTNVAFREAQGYKSVNSAGYSLQVRPAGQGTVVLNVDRAVFRNNESYTVWAVGRLSNGSLAALVTQDDF